MPAQPTPPAKPGYFGITPAIAGCGIRHVAQLPEGTPPAQAEAFAADFRAFCKQHGLREGNAQGFITASTSHAEAKS